MKWTPKQRKIAEVIMKHRKDDGFEFKACQDELNDVDKSVISRVGQSLKKNNWQVPPTEKTKPEKATKRVLHCHPLLLKWLESVYKPATAEGP